MMPTISVIIPVYNGASLVARAIDSALGQSMTPLEVIVIDDGSTDDTPKVLARYGKRIRVLAIAHGGVSRARNAGIEASRGELLAFLDADDVWQRTKLACQVAALHAWPQAGLCCCDYLVLHAERARMVSHFDGALRKAGLHPAQTLLAEPLPALIRCNFVGTASNVLLRRDIALRAGRFDPQLRQAEDYDYWLRCAMLTPFVLLATPLMEKRSHGANLTGNILETEQCHEQVLQAWAAKATLPAGSATLLNDALSRVRYRIARQWALRGKAGTALAYCLRGWRSEHSVANWARACRTLARCLVHLMTRRRRTEPA
jgi:glycosyltransferase involved in cell wall biosynthesis